MQNVEWISLILKWATSGPVGIIVGVVAMLLGGAGFLAFVKKMKGNKFKGTLDDSAASAGRISGEVSSGMKANTDLGSTWAEQEQARLIKEQVKLTVPTEVFANEPFNVVVTGVSQANTLYADKTWRLGSILPDTPKEVLLNSAGQRTIDLLVGKTWISSPITVKGKV
jgi:hypothetical protein